MVGLLNEKRRWALIGRWWEKLNHLVQLEPPGPRGLLVQLPIQAGSIVGWSNGEDQIRKAPSGPIQLGSQNIGGRQVH